VTSSLFGDFEQERQRIRTNAVSAWYNGTMESELEKVEVPACQIIPAHV
jgi:hypothetical protein